MKTLKLISITSTALCLYSCNEKKVIAEKYNVIYILADDLGYGDLGCYGQSKISTPNIDSLAKQGMLFTQHYSGCTVSAPSRSSLLTGQHTGHTPIRGNKGGEVASEEEGQYPLPANAYTLAEMFKEAKYSTGAFGKWGLGHPASEGDPTKQGFDEFFGYNCQAQAHRYYPTHLWHNLQKIQLIGNDKTNKTVYAQDIIHKRALEFITKNKNRNFFAFLPYTLPHAELLAPNDSILLRYLKLFDEPKPYIAPKGGDYGNEMNYASYCSQIAPRAHFAAMVTRLDRYVGDVMKLVDSLGIKEKTIIVFTSDNGPHAEGGADPDFFQSSGKLRGTKRDLYEGGIRVPMIASCPGLIAAGTKSVHISAFWDILPTFAEMTGVLVKSPMDGKSFYPTLIGNIDSQKKHDFLYWEFHEQGGKIAVRKGNWKAVKRNILSDPMAAIELYDLSNDIHEDNNVAVNNPDIVQEMEQIMKNARIESEVFPFQ